MAESTSPSPWVCALRVDYSDGTHENRIVHRGPEAECERLAGLVPASTYEPTSERHRGLSPAALPEAVDIRVPEGKLALYSTVIVCREDQLDT